MAYAESVANQKPGNLRVCVTFNEKTLIDRILKKERNERIKQEIKSVHNGYLDFLFMSRSKTVKEKIRDLYKFLNKRSLLY